MQEKDEPVIVGNTNNNAYSQQKNYEIKCTECEYTTKERKHLRGHMLAHTGQYQCQHGCKEWFKTTKTLDEHHTKEHITVNRTTEFECEDCEQRFSSKFHLRKHIQNEHADKKKSCDICGLIIRNEKELNKHIDEKHEQQGFQDVKKKACHFFRNGNCLKGEHCRYSHDESRRDGRENISECRNGVSCAYYARGVCRYLHRNRLFPTSQTQISQRKNSSDGNETYQSSQSQTSWRYINRWCKFLEDCTRVPNCSYKHYDEVFPQLPNTTNPPWQRKSSWEEY